MALGRRRAQLFDRANGAVSVRLPAEVRQELVAVAEMTLQLVDGPADPIFPPEDAPPEPEDPALARLLPTAYRDDTEAASEYRRLAEGELRSGKRQDAELLKNAAAADRISEPEAEAWLRAMTDVRLVLAVRLGIETDEDAELLAGLAAAGRAEPAKAALLATFARLGYLSELLIEALDS